jgi:Protein of unknown function (DUF2441)
VFHFQPSELHPGTVIEPGNFGRLIREAHEGIPFNGRVVVSGMLCREMLFELTRVQHYPQLPSRLACVFVIPTWEDALAYGKNNNADGRQILHEVSLVNSNASTHTAWISHCTMQSGGSFLNQMEPKGHAYWLGQLGNPSDGRELLVAGAVRVLRRV